MTGPVTKIVMVGTPFTCTRAFPSLEQFFQRKGYDVVITACEDELKSALHAEGTIVIVMGTYGEWMPIIDAEREKGATAYALFFTSFLAGSGLECAHPVPDSLDVFYTYIFKLLVRPSDMLGLVQQLEALLLKV